MKISELISKLEEIKINDTVYFLAHIDTDFYKIVPHRVKAILHFTNKIYYKIDTNVKECYMYDFQQKDVGNKVFLKYNDAVKYCNKKGFYYEKI